MLSRMWASGKFFTLCITEWSQSPICVHRNLVRRHWQREDVEQVTSLRPQDSENTNLLQVFLTLQTSPQTYASLSVNVGHIEFQGLGLV